MRGLCIAATIGCALVGGVLFAFSAFVMEGLRRLAPAQAIGAMQLQNTISQNAQP